MNFRLRFAILFTFFVAVLSATSLYTVYVLYANYRENDYYNRLEDEATSFLSEFNKNPEDTFNLKERLNALHSGTLLNEQIAIYNEYGNKLYEYSDSIDLETTAVIFNSIIRKNKLRYQFNNREHLGIFDNKAKTIVIISALDKFGLNKTNNLRVILLVVFFGGIALTGFFSFFFVNEAFKPLNRLSKQIQITNENNLNERIEESHRDDELNQIAKNFNAMLERLNSAFESQKKFVQHASHELRTPLSNMLSTTENAIKKVPDNKIFLDILHSLKDEQEKLIELSNALLMLSQNAKMQFSNNWPVHRVDELLYTAISMKKKVFPDANITLNFVNLPDEVQQLDIQCHEVLIVTAFKNIIKNAYLYSSDKSVNISINLIKTGIEIDFVNKGNQIPKAQQDDIMKPFNRGFNSEGKKGFGLGLSIVQGIIEMHKANLQYIPKDTDTNIFRITFYYPS
ncbi:MAG: ATP-binding protein [Chitinophagaceae bacterium]